MTETSPRPRRTVWTFVLWAVVYALDQITKVLAVEHLEPGVVRPFVGELLQFHLIRNPGAAFSFATGMTWIFTVLAAVVVVVVVRLARKLRSTAWALALGFLLAGATGNLTDRLLRQPGPMRGHVIDFLMLPNWPIFNVADMCINVAAALILVQAFRGVRLDGTRVADDEDPDAVDGDAADAAPVDTPVDAEPTDRHARAEQDTP